MKRERLGKTHVCDDRSVEGFVIRCWAEDQAHKGKVMWVDFEIIHIIGWSGDKADLYEGEPPTDDLDKAEAMVCGFVKWDGCTQFEADIHIDGHHGLLQVFVAIVKARKLCAAAMFPGALVQEEYP